MLKGTNDKKPTASFVVAAWMDLPPEQKAQAADAIYKLNNNNNGFSNNGYFAPSIFQPSSTPPPPPTSSTQMYAPVPVPVSMIEEQQHAKSTWANQSRMETVKQPPRQEHQVTPTRVRTRPRIERPEGSVPICKNPRCKCFGFVKEGEENFHWNPVKIIIYCDGERWENKTVDQLRELAQDAVGGIEERKKYVKHTYAEEYNEYGPRESRLICRNHQAAVQAIWAIYKARTTYDISVNWGKNHDEEEEDENHEEEEHEK